jgi:hypothetical protein
MYWQPSPKILRQTHSLVLHSRKPPGIHIQKTAPTGKPISLRTTCGRYNLGKTRLTFKPITDYPPDPRQILLPRRLYNRRNRHLSLRPVRLQATPTRDDTHPDRLRQHRLRHRCRSGSLQIPSCEEDRQKQQMHPRDR